MEVANTGKKSKKLYKYICEVCGKKITNLLSLKKHIKLHIQDQREPNPRKTSIRSSYKTKLDLKRLNKIKKQKTFTDKKKIQVSSDRKTQDSGASSSSTNLSVNSTKLSTEHMKIHTGESETSSSHINTLTENLNAATNICKTQIGVSESSPSETKNNLTSNSVSTETMEIHTAETKSSGNIETNTEKLYPTTINIHRDQTAAEVKCSSSDNSNLTSNSFSAEQIQTHTAQIASSSHVKTPENLSLSVNILRGQTAASVKSSASDSNLTLNSFSIEHIPTHTARKASSSRVKTHTENLSPAVSILRGQTKASVKSSSDSNLTSNSSSTEQIPTHTAQITSSSRVQTHTKNLSPAVSIFRSPTKAPVKSSSDSNLTSNSFSTEQIPTHTAQVASSSHVQTHTENLNPSINIRRGQTGIKSSSSDTNCNLTSNSFSIKHIPTHTAQKASSSHIPTHTENLNPTINIHKDQIVVESSSSNADLNLNPCGSKSMEISTSKVETSNLHVGLHTENTSNYTSNFSNPEQTQIPTGHLQTYTKTLTPNIHNEHVIVEIEPSSSITHPNLNCDMENIKLITEALNLHSSKYNLNSCGMEHMQTPIDKNKPSSSYIKTNTEIGKHPQVNTDTKTYTETNTKISKKPRPNVSLKNLDHTYSKSWQLYGQPSKKRAKFHISKVEKVQIPTKNIKALRHKIHNYMDHINTETVNSTGNIQAHTEVKTLSHTEIPKKLPSEKNNSDKIIEQIENLNNEYLKTHNKIPSDTDTNNEHTHMHAEIKTPYCHKVYSNKKHLKSPTANIDNLPTHTETTTTLPVKTHTGENLIPSKSSIVKHNEDKSNIEDFNRTPSIPAQDAMKYTMSQQTAQQIAEKHIESCIEDKNKDFSESTACKIIHVAEKVITVHSEDKEDHLTLYKIMQAAEKHGMSHTEGVKENLAAYSKPKTPYKKRKIAEKQDSQISTINQTPHKRMQALKKHMMSHTESKKEDLVTFTKPKTPYRRKKAADKHALSDTEGVKDSSATFTKPKTPLQVAEKHTSHAETVKEDSATLTKPKTPYKAINTAEKHLPYNEAKKEDSATFTKPKTPYKRKQVAAKHTTSHNVDVNDELTTFNSPKTPHKEMQAAEQHVLSHTESKTPHNVLKTAETQVTSHTKGVQEDLPTITKSKTPQKALKHTEGTSHSKSIQEDLVTITKSKTSQKVLKPAETQVTSRTKGVQENLAIITKSKTQHKVLKPAETQVTSHMKGVQEDLVTITKSKTPQKVLKPAETQVTSHTKGVQENLAIITKSKTPHKVLKPAETQVTSHAKGVQEDLATITKSKTPQKVLKPAETQVTSHTKGVQEDLPTITKSKTPQKVLKPAETQVTSHTKGVQENLAIITKSKTPHKVLKPAETQVTSHTKGVQEDLSTFTKSETPHDLLKTAETLVTLHTKCIQEDLATFTKPNPPHDKLKTAETLATLHSVLKPAETQVSSHTKGMQEDLATFTNSKTPHSILKTAETQVTSHTKGVQENLPTITKSKTPHSVLKTAETQVTSPTKGVQKDLATITKSKTPYSVLKTTETQVTSHTKGMQEDLATFTKSKTPQSVLKTTEMQVTLHAKGIEEDLATFIKFKTPHSVLKTAEIQVTPHTKAVQKDLATITKSKTPQSVLKTTETQVTSHAKGVQEDLATFTKSKTPQSVLKTTEMQVTLHAKDIEEDLATFIKFKTPLSVLKTAETQVMSHTKSVQEATFTKTPHSVLKTSETQVTSLTKGVQEDLAVFKKPETPYKTAANPTGKPVMSYTEGVKGELEIFIQPKTPNKTINVTDKQVSSNTDALKGDLVTFTTYKPMQVKSHTEPVNEDQATFIKPVAENSTISHTETIKEDITFAIPKTPYRGIKLDDNQVKSRAGTVKLDFSTTKPNTPYKTVQFVDKHMIPCAESTKEELITSVPKSQTKQSVALHTVSKKENLTTRVVEQHKMPHTGDKTVQFATNTSSKTLHVSKHIMHCSEDKNKDLSVTDTLNKTEKTQDVVENVLPRLEDQIKEYLDLHMPNRRRTKAKKSVDKKEQITTRTISKTVPAAVKQVDLHIEHQNKEHSMTHNKSPYKKLQSAPNDEDKIKEQLAMHNLNQTPHKSEYKGKKLLAGHTVEKTPSKIQDTEKHVTADSNKDQSVTHPMTKSPRRSIPPSKHITAESGYKNKDHLMVHIENRTPYKMYPQKLTPMHKTKQRLAKRSTNKPPTKPVVEKHVNPIAIEENKPLVKHTPATEKQIPLHTEDKTKLLTRQTGDKSPDRKVQTAKKHKISPEDKDDLVTDTAKKIKTMPNVEVQVMSQDKPLATTNPILPIETQVSQTRDQIGTHTAKKRLSKTTKSTEKQITPLTKDKSEEHLVTHTANKTPDQVSSQITDKNMEHVGTHTVSKTLSKTIQSEEKPCIYKSEEDLATGTADKTLTVDKPISQYMDKDKEYIGTHTAKKRLSRTKQNLEKQVTLFKAKSEEYLPAQIPDKTQVVEKQNLSQTTDTNKVHIETHSPKKRFTRAIQNLDKQVTPCKAKSEEHLATHTPDKIPTIQKQDLSHTTDKNNTGTQTAKDSLSKTIQAVKKYVSNEDKTAPKGKDMPNISDEKEQLETHTVNETSFKIIQPAEKHLITHTENENMRLLATICMSEAEKHNPHTELNKKHLLKYTPKDSVPETIHAIEKYVTSLKKDKEHMATHTINKTPSKENITSVEDKNEEHVPTHPAKERLCKTIQAVEKHIAAPHKDESVKQLITHTGNKTQPKGKCVKQTENKELMATHTVNKTPNKVLQPPEKHVSSTEDKKTKLLTTSSIIVPSEIKPTTAQTGDKDHLPKHTRTRSLSKTIQAVEKHITPHTGVKNLEASETSNKMKSPVVKHSAPHTEDNLPKRSPKSNLSKTSVEKDITEHTEHLLSHTTIKTPCKTKQPLEKSITQHTEDNEHVKTHTASKPQSIEPEKSIISPTEDNKEHVLTHTVKKSEVKVTEKSVVSSTGENKEQVHIVNRSPSKTTEEKVAPITKAKNKQHTLEPIGNKRKNEHLQSTPDIKRRKTSNVEYDNSTSKQTNDECETQQNTEDMTQIKSEEISMTDIQIHTDIKSPLQIKIENSPRKESRLHSPDKNIEINKKDATLHMRIPTENKSTDQIHTQDSTKHDTLNIDNTEESIQHLQIHTDNKPTKINVQSKKIKLTKDIPKEENEQHIHTGKKLKGKNKKKLIKHKKHIVVPDEENYHEYAENTTQINLSKHIKEEIEDKSDEKIQDKPSHVNKYFKIKLPRKLVSKNIKVHVQNKRTKIKRTGNKSASHLPHTSTKTENPTQSENKIKSKDNISAVKSKRTSGVLSHASTNTQRDPIELAENALELKKNLNTIKELTMCNICKKSLGDFRSIRTHMVEHIKKRINV